MSKNKTPSECWAYFNNSGNDGMTAINYKGVTFLNVAWL